MKHKLLASLAVGTLGANAFLGHGLAHASPDLETGPEVSAVMGPGQEYQQGLTVNGVAPVLRSVTVDGDTILAYCIEYWVRAAAPDHQAVVTDWDGFTGDNNFKTSSQVREAVAWILHNSYPAVSLQELGERTDSASLTAAEAIAATQAAIWFYTDDFATDGELTVAGAPDDDGSLTTTSRKNVQGIFAHLTGEQNVGLTEHAVQTTVALSDATTVDASVPEAVLESVPSEDGHFLGPVVVNSSADQVDLHLEVTDPTITLDEIDLLDINGEPLDTTAPIAAEEFWVHVPAHIETGGIQIAAESIEHGYTGRLIIPEPASDRRFQTIVMVDQITATATTDLVLRWEQAVVPEPIPESPPAEEPPVEDASETEETSDDETVQPVAANDTQAMHEHPVSQPQPTASAREEPAAQAAELGTVVVDSEEAVELSNVDQASTEVLAETGAHQTRNVLVALATLSVGATLLLIHRLRPKRT